MPYHNEANLGVLFWKSLQSLNMTILAFILAFSCLLHVLCTYHHRSYMQEHEAHAGNKFYPHCFTVKTPTITLYHKTTPCKQAYDAKPNLVIIPDGLVICLCQSVHCLTLKQFLFPAQLNSTLTTGKNYTVFLKILATKA